MEASSLVRSTSLHLRPSRLRRMTSARPSSIHVSACDRRPGLRRLRSDPIIAARSAPFRLEREEGKESFGGGDGKGGNLTGGGNGGSRGGDQNQSENNKRIHDMYKRMLRCDPTNPLILTNYGKFLHEVESDIKGAEEMYSRALLENPVEGETLMLYGRLLWDKQRDKDRAEVYMDRAAEASPNDSEVLRARALFQWEAGEDEEGDVEESQPLSMGF